MKKKGNNHSFVQALTSFFILSIIVLTVSYYFVLKNGLIGIAFIFLGFVSLAVLKFFKIKIKTVYPDLIFGLIDNGVLVFTAVIGAQIAGIPGAIVGGAAGNTVTDGIGGLFEGHIAENQRKYKIENWRNSLSTSLGKMAGCLFGAGIGLLIVWGFSVASKMI